MLSSYGVNIATGSTIRNKPVLFVTVFSFLFWFTLAGYNGAMKIVITMNELALRAL